MPSLRLTTQLPRRAPQSLSLGSLGVATRTMKSYVLYPLLIVLLFLVPVGHCEEERQASPAAQEPPLSRAGLGALEHASKLIAAINLLDWKTVEATTSPEGHVLFLKRDATTQKDWPGVGAYRGSVYDPERGTLRHRFAYGSFRTTPHEVWLYYSIAGDEFTFSNILILGW